MNLIYKTSEIKKKIVLIGYRFFNQNFSFAAVFVTADFFNFIKFFFTLPCFIGLNKYHTNKIMFNNKQNFSIF